MLVKMNKALKNRNGSSLLEVVIFIGIVSLFFVAIAYSTTSALQRTETSKSRILATRHSEALEQWIRGEKEENWVTFLAQSSQEGTTYCFNGDLVDWPVTSGSCASDAYDLDNLYKREATLTTSIDSSTVTVTINTEWRDRGNVFNVDLTTVLARYD